MLETIFQINAESGFNKRQVKAAAVVGYDRPIISAILVFPSTNESSTLKSLF
jgi:hypothetical protein